MRGNHEIKTTVSFSYRIITNERNIIGQRWQKLLLETSQGQVEIEFLPELAPNHVDRIAELASSGFYDGIIFHRVIPGFMAQTGDPTGTGMAVLAPIWMRNSPIMNTVLARLAWPVHQAQTVATANFSSASMDVDTLQVSTLFGDRWSAAWKLWKNLPLANHLPNLTKLSQPRLLIRLIS